MSEEKARKEPPSLEALGFTHEELQVDILKVRHALIEEITQRPPTIGLVGVSGVGKSSTINKFFKTNLPVSDIVACTKEFRNVDLQLKPTEQGILATLPVPPEIFEEPVHLRVVDAPGLGEDISRDPAYLKMYHEHLPECDVIVWIIAARNRALALDQQYLREFSAFYPKMAFGMNQVDLIEPMTWDHTINLPSDDLLDSINAAAEDRKKKIEDIVQKPVDLIPYSSKYGFNLQHLFTRVVEACEGDRAWMFSAIKAFRGEDFIPAWALEQALGDTRKTQSKTGFAGFLKSLGKDRRKG